MTLTPERLAELRKTMTARVESGWMTVDTRPFIEVLDLLVEKDAEIEQIRGVVAAVTELADGWAVAVKRALKGNFDTTFHHQLGQCADQLHATLTKATE